MAGSLDPFFGPHTTVLAPFCAVQGLDAKLGAWAGTGVKELMENIDVFCCGSSDAKRIEIRVLLADFGLWSSRAVWAEALGEALDSHVG